MIGPRMHSRGVTLVELLVVLAVLGIMAAFVGLAWRAPAPGSARNPVSDARQRAIRSGAAVQFQVVIDADTITAMALPDGSIIAPGTLPVDPLSGAPARATTHD